MDLFYCSRCSKNSISPRGGRCFHCGQDETPRTPNTGNVQPLVLEPGKANHVYHVPVSDASPETTFNLEPSQDTRTQTTFILEPIQVASNEPTNSDFSYFAPFIGCYGYEGGCKIIRSSQEGASQFSDQNVPVNPETRKDNIYNMTSGRFNPVTISNSLASMNDSHVAPKQRTYLDEQPPMGKRQNIPNREKILKKQKTDYAEKVNEDGKLNFAGSISFLSEYECPNTNPGSSGNVNKPGGSPENSNSSAVIARRGNNPSINDRFPKNVDPTKAVLEQYVQNSGKSAGNVFKQRVPAKRFHRCWKCGKAYKKESIFKFHVENNCDPKPHKCDQCEMKFPYESNLRIHQRVHTVEKPFKCDQCTFTTKWEFDLKVHKERYH